MTEPGRERRPWPLRLALGLAAVLVLGGVLGAALLAGLPLPGMPATARGSASTGATPARSPEPGDPEQVTRAWLREHLQQLLERQAAALLRGDERAFLSVAAPSTDAATDLKRQFRALRALRVTAWRPMVRDEPVRSGGHWTVSVTVEHCFVVPGCRTSPVTMGTEWADGRSGPRLVALEHSPPARDGPRPWEVDDLAVVVGARTLVATTPEHRSRLPELLRQAERAAAVADRYAVGRPPPDRYRIFYAGRAEWTRWYGGGRASWTAGYAVGVGGDRYEVVLNASGLHARSLDDLLRHELTHAATLPGRGISEDNWWLAEGIAEFAAARSQPLSRYDNLPDLRRLLRAGWDGELATAKPPASATDWQVGARYAVSYLAVRHLVDRFGEQQVLGFIESVLQGGQPLQDAARQHFGLDWAPLQDDCISYVRGVAT